MRPPERVGYDELIKTFPGFDDPVSVPAVPLVGRSRYGHASLNELAIMANIVRVREPSVIFEFGRFDGLTTLCLAISAPSAKIYTLNLPEDMEEAHVPEAADPEYAKVVRGIARDRWETAGVRDRIEEILVDSAEFQPEEKLFANVDFIFVDAGHDYKDVRRDTESSLSMLSPSGIVMWHDYYKRKYPSVTAYIAEFAELHDVFWIESPGHPDYLETSLCYHLRAQEADAGKRDEPPEPYDLASGAPV